MARFTVPAGAEATEPAEQRGLARDGVRLLVARPGGIHHTVFRRLADHLGPGDVLIVNTSATLPSAVNSIRAGGVLAPVHVAAQLDDSCWVVEFRLPDNGGPDLGIAVGEEVQLAGRVGLTVLDSYPQSSTSGSRLWRVLATPQRDRVPYLLDHGRPIRYGYLSRPWPLADLQNVYAEVAGSAEMASAGRPLTARLLVRLMARGVAIAPIVLHTGVSSPEKHEPPMPEWFDVPAPTARLVNATREAGGRVVAVGTTSTRALESVADASGIVRSGHGWTDVVLSSERPARVVTGLISGLHEPEASHLMLLEAVAGRALVAAAYGEAVEQRYLWHEFGDSMLFVP